MGKTDSTIVALGIKITNTDLKDAIKDSSKLDSLLKEINKEKVEPEVKLEFDENFNKQMQDEFIKLSQFYNKNLSKFNLTKKYSEALGFGLDKNNSQEDRVKKLQEMIAYSQQLFDLQKSVGKTNDLSILDENQISKLLKAQDAIIKKQDAYDEALKKNRRKAKEIGTVNALHNETEIIREANARGIRKGKIASEIASDTAKKYGISESDLESRESRQLLSNYAKTVDLFKELKKEQSELGKADLTRVDNAEKYLITSRRVLDVYKQIEEQEKTISFVFDRDGANGLQNKLATKTDSKVNKDNKLLTNALNNRTDGAYQLYAVASSKKAESGLNSARLDFQNKLNSYYQKQADKTTKAAENIVAKSQKKIDELQSKKAELKESQSSSSSASVVSQADLDLLNKYNLSVDECVEKVKELEEYITSVSGDNNQSKFDKAEQDQLLYFQRAKELDEEKLRSSLDKDTYEYLDDNADILNKQSKAILDALRNQSTEAATEIKTVQEEIIAGENQVQQEIEESKAAQQEAASTAQIAHEEVAKASDASQETVKASEQMASQKQVEAGVVEAREKIVESVDGLQDKVINFKIEGIEQAKSDLAQVNNILSQIPNEKDIKVSLINSDDAPFLTDPHGNMITAYRGVNDVYGGLFSSDDGFTFFTDSLADEVNKVANEAEKTTSDTKKKAETNTSKSNKKNNQKKANEDIDSAKAQAKAALARKLKQEKDEQKAIDEQNKLTKQRLINKTKQTKQNLKDQARERAAQQKAEQKESDKIQKEQKKKQKKLEKEQEKSANRESLESGLKDKQIKNLGKLEKFTTDANGSATLRFIGEVDGKLTETTVKVRDFQSALEALKKEESTPGSFAEYANSMTGTKSKDLSGEKKAFQTATSIRAKEIAGDVLSQNQVNILNQLRQKYEEIKAKAGEATQAEKEFASAFEQMNATAANNAFNKQIDAYNKLAGQSEGMLPGYKERLEEIRSSIEHINSMEINPDESGEIQDISELRSQLQAFSKDVKSGMYTPASESGIESARERLATIMATNTKASSGRFKPQFENLQGIAGSLNVGTTSQLDLEKFNAQISNLKANIDSANKAGASFGSMWKQRMGSLAAYLTTFASFYRIIEIIKDTANTVRELDTAMVELQKVSDASATRLQQSFENSKNTAKELGVTIQETINATADWSRLGYSVDQAEELAKVAVIYKHVGDGIDIDTANESLISTLQGFKMNATEAMDIIDKFNETANNMPIDSAGIGEALQRSAASFHAANTDLSESIALITGANAVVQDPSRVGRHI